MSYLISERLHVAVHFISFDSAVELEAPTFLFAPCGRYLAVGSRCGGGAFAFLGAWASLVLWGVAVSPPARRGFRRWLGPLHAALACVDYVGDLLGYVFLRPRAARFVA